MRKLEKKTKKTWKVLKMKLKTDTAQTQTAIRTATSPSWTTQDTALIEEEDWIDFMKRSTDEAMEHMKNTRIQCWIKNSQKNEMEIGDENRIGTGRKVGGESSWMGPWTQYKIQNLQSRRKTKKEDGKMRSTNSSSLKKLKRQQEITWSVTARGSKRQET